MYYAKNKIESFEQEVIHTQLEVQRYMCTKAYDELYGNIGQLLSSTKLLISIAKKSIDQVPETLITADKVLGKAIKDLRVLSRPLHKQWIREFAFFTNLETEIVRINDLRQSQWVSYTCSSGDICLLPASQLMLFRIVQEALQNVVNHANAQTIRIEIVIAKQQIAITIIDDGVGFRVSRKVFMGLGIATMRYRASLLGGSIQWLSLPGKGTKLCIQIPQKINS